uniref:Hypothetical conserved protein n=1 Tax=Caldiarchaeum subterraneum TaxID=311458 RepID=E6N2Q1_CALS0|nr:hypothetical conserved protein [Candidatus Caldarchaeum subterraneum]
MRGKIIGLVVFAAAAVLVTMAVNSWTVNTSTTETTVQLTIYRTEQCPCCKEYEAYLRNSGIPFRTVVVSGVELENVRKKLGVPRELYSCHTASAMQYFIEGHTPAEALKKLLEEKPLLKGIAVPGMPPGSPGMGGVKTEPLKIYALKPDGNIVVWMMS